ncbi:MAG TPA: hypothetical protein VFB81_23115, partial [Myxococcales bacterium]|nr:hypothetical protein [Myxococcales bacterium]
KTGLRALCGVFLVAQAMAPSSGCASTAPEKPTPQVGSPAPTSKELRARARVAYEEKQYAECARLFAEVERAGDGDGSIQKGPWTAYESACCQALTGDREAAFGSLRRALDRGFKDSSHLEQDPDLASLRDDPRWAGLVTQAQARQEAYLKTLNTELYQLFKEDQADRIGSDAKKDWKEVEARDTRRRERVTRILEAGGAKVSDDYFHAAMVFQHGPAVGDIQQAHQLALKAVELDPESKLARWLAAASKDRELLMLKKPQLYGTQFTIENGKWVLYQVDPSITDAEREKWNVPPLEEAKKRAERMNAGR